MSGKQYTFTSDGRGKHGGKVKQASDGGAGNTVIPAVKLPGHDPNMDLRRNTVNSLRAAIDELYNLASGKLGADAIYERIEKHIDDIAKWRV